MKTIPLLLINSLFINGLFGDETERVSVNDGGSVTLHTHLTELKGDDVIVWRFKGDRIARINRAVKNSDPVYDPDVRFTDRLKMNPQTGDLTITNITSELTGLYKLENINGDNQTKSFFVTVSERFINGDGEDARSSTGLSPGVIAGICVPLLLLTAGVVIYRRRIMRRLLIYRRRIMRRQNSNTGQESIDTSEPLRNGDASNGDETPL